MHAKIAKATAIAAALFVPIASPSAAQEKELTMGFITTLSGGAAILGKAQVNGLRLGLEKHGWKKNGDTLSGVPLNVIVEDDQAKPQIGLNLTRKLIQSDNAQIIGGILWSHVMHAIRRHVQRTGRIILGTNAGPSLLAGKACSRLFVSTSFQNDQAARSMGELFNADKVKDAFLLAPNYQAGKDYLAGFRSTYEGKEAGVILFKVGQTDFQADISKIRAAKPSGLFVFAPGGMGIAFMKQWAASGITETKVYTIHTVDYLTLKPIGKSALGSQHTNQWNPDLDNDRNKEFIKNYMARHGSMPSTFSVPSYDAVTLLADALDAVKGNIDDLPKLAAAMRKGGLRSVRGDLKYNVNGFLIQPWYRRTVVLNDQGVPVIEGGEQVMFQKDAFWENCPESERIAVR